MRYTTRIHSGNKTVISLPGLQPILPGSLVLVKDKLEAYKVKTLPPVIAVIKKGKEVIVDFEADSAPIESVTFRI